MSTVQQYQTDDFEVINDKISVLDLKRKEDPESVVWYNYKAGTIVKGSKTIDRREVPSDNVILNLKPHFQAKKEYLAGKRTWDEYITEGYSKEYEKDAYTFQEYIDRSRQRNENLLEAAAAVIRPEHFAALQSTAINEVIISMEGTNHNLLQTVTTVEMDKLNQRFILDISDDQTGLVSHDIGEEGLPTEIGPYKYSAKSIGLALNGTKLVIAGSVKLTAFDFDVLSPFAQITENAITNDKHAMIAKIMNGAGFTSSAIATDWDLLDTNGRPTAKAYKDINVLKTSIRGDKKGAANWLVSPENVFEVYKDNSATLGANVTGPVENNVPNEGNYIAGNIPRLAGMRWAVDDLIDPDSLIVLNSRAIYFAQGPRRSSTMNNSITGNFGNVNLEYYKAHLVFPNLIKRYTAVST